MAHVEGKLLLVWAIKNQEEGCLARQVLEEQLDLGLPGPAADVGLPL